MAGSRPTSGEPSVELELSQTRVRHAYLLKMSGKHPNEIAEDLNFPSGLAVIKAINDQLNRDALMESEGDRRQLIQLQDDRLNFMLSRLWPAIEHGDPKSIDAGLRVIGMINKLHQLDIADTASQTTQVLVIGGAEKDYIESLKQLTEK